MVKIKSRGAFGLITRNTTTLVGGVGLIQLPGGKQEEEDQNNILSTFYRELYQEVGFKGVLELAQVFQDPLVQCFCSQGHQQIRRPQGGQVIDIRYTYRFEAVGRGYVSEVDAGEFPNPRFAPHKQLEGLQGGSEIRWSTLRAMQMYAGREAWPKVTTRKRQSPFGSLEEQFRKMGFSEAFIEAEVGPIREAEAASASRFRRLTYA